MFRRGQNGGLKSRGRLSQGRSLESRLGSQQVNRAPHQRRRRREGLRRGMGFLGAVLGRLAGLAGMMLASGLLLVGGYAALAHGSTFAVRQAQVLGTDNLSSLEVLKAADIGIDSNLLALPVSKVLARVRQVPWVERAWVERLWPDTVRIRVVERRPYLLALVEGELRCLDADLRPFAAMRPQEALDLPLLSGLSRADLLEPDDEMLELTQAAKRLLETLPPEIVSLAGPLSEVHVDRVWGLSLVFKDLPATVRLGFARLETAWPRLQKVVADLVQRGELSRATLIDLDSKRRIVVRLGREAA